jgi:hypothetical protein
MSWPAPAQGGREAACGLSNLYIIISLHPPLASIVAMLLFSLTCSPTCTNARLMLLGQKENGNEPLRTSLPTLRA